MSYSLHSFRNRTDQDENMWSGHILSNLVENSKGRTLHRIFDEYLSNKNTTILEAGCGMGIWVHCLKQKGHDILGIDYMTSTVDKVKSIDKSFPIAHGDVNNLEFENNTFDAYISLGVVEHFESGPQKALSEAHRVLKPGGLAFISVPYLNNVRRFITHPLRSAYFALRKILGGKDYFWEYRYSKKELKDFLKNAGFNIIYTDIDDYIVEDKKHHIGIYADFFFLRSRKGELWELNRAGKLLTRIGNFISPWSICSGILMISQK